MSLEVEWDDGHFSSTTGYTVFYWNLSHTYASNGLYHVRVSGDDNLGHYFDYGPFDITID